jgi:hypothetical protein
VEHKASFRPGDRLYLSSEPAFAHTRIAGNQGDRGSRSFDSAHERGAEQIELDLAPSKLGTRDLPTERAAFSNRTSRR